MKLILFDIDGTLIDSGGAGMRSMDLAFEELFSVPKAFSSINMAGKTDLQILKECFSIHRIPGTNGEVPSFFSAYLKFLAANIEGRGHLKPGIRGALEALKGVAGCTTGLLTGNIERGAYIKLDAFGIAEYFEVGAFGNEHEDRNMLLPIAVGKLQKTKGIQAVFSDCVVIGDTPRDVECAKPYGARTIAVATGPYSAAVLRDAGADVVFEDLSDTEKVLEAIC